jgi:hypothetical protein
MTSPSVVSGDPWHWTVDDVIACIRHPQSFIHGTRLADLPDIDALENHLRQKAITGATFLTALDGNTLQTELRTFNFGQRVTLLNLIKQLRGRSVAYTRLAAIARVQAFNTGNASTTTLPAQLPNPLTSATVAEASGRKRQKRAHVTTVQLENVQQQQQRPEASVGDPTVLDQFQPNVDGNGQWDYLLRWEQVDENTLGVDDLAASGIDDEEEEDHDDIGDAAEDEAAEISDGADNNEDAQTRSKLSRDQVVDIINERIEHFTNIWKPNQGVLKGDEVNYDPVAMREKAENANETSRYIKAYEADAAYYCQRLDKLCDEIAKFPGRSADAVRHQCRNLEVTVNSIELSKWLLSIYQSDSDSGEDDDGEEQEQEQEERPNMGSLSLDQADQRSMAHHTQSPLVQANQTSMVRPTQPSLGLADQHSWTNLAQPTTDIIDFGSPPESYQGELDEVLVESSPPPQLLVVVQENHFNVPRRSLSPDSVIAETVEYTADIPVSVPVRLQAQYGDQPEHASTSTACRWRWTELVAARDRKRIVTKALQEMREEDRETIRSRLKTVGTADLIREIPTCIKMLIKKKTKIPGVLPRDMPKILTFTRLYLSWWLCDNYFRLEPTQWGLEELEQCYQEGSPDPSTFCDYLNKIMTTTFSPLALQAPDQPSQAEIIEISDDDDDQPPPPSTWTKHNTQFQHPDTVVLD